MIKIIPYTKHTIDNKDISAVVNVLKNYPLTQGIFTNKLEQEFCKYTNSKYSIAVNSCTSALFLAYQALDLKKNDVLWTSPITFVATSNAALMNEAKVDFVDINLQTFNMDLEKLEKKLIFAKKNKVLPKIISIVHLGGLSVEMQKIYILKKKYGFKIVEDACHAIGASYLNNKVGSCKFSDVTVFSLHAAKSVTCGEGGVVCLNSKKLYEKIKLARSHGIKKNIKTISTGRQVSLGYNYRITDFQSALAVSQIKKIDKFRNKKKKIFELYKKKLSKFFIFQGENSSFNNIHGLHICIMLIKKGDSKKLIDFLKKKKIIAIKHYKPIFTQPYYAKLIKNKSKEYFPNTYEYFKKTITIPMYPDLGKKECNYIVASILKFFNQK
ncbi:DegT/DnrJ/EryC1/StrS aminotransferase family protein [bacterium]|nr:DegT/DnrJ/EryC1/StrS aminotransferase family protein [bacterium]